MKVKLTFKTDIIESAADGEISASEALRRAASELEARIHLAASSGKGLLDVFSNVSIIPNDL